jgi:hypothetical protein
MQFDHRVYLSLVMSVHLPPAARPPLGLFERRAREAQCAELIKSESDRIEFDFDIEIGIIEVA